ncbi:hypothetical protein KY284_012938 [Solanum tuberosum]|nr:hypothetical protein KY284_012938 [Solanum tuberosum]
MFSNGTSLPKAKGKNVILVVVDRLSKCGYLMSLQHPYTAQDVAQCYLDRIFKLHGVVHSARSLVAKIYCISPQTDGQTKVLNRTLETYLRCFYSDKPLLWPSYLPLAEWWYNTTYHIAIKFTPFEVLYCQNSPIHPYLVGEAANEMVDRSLKAREAIIELLKFHISWAQHRMKDLANSHRSDRVFAVGDWVYLKLQPYRQVSVAGQPFNKLATKYYGPYIIDARVGPVTYKLLLHVEVLIHPIFHVSQLKRYHEVPRDISILQSYNFPVQTVRHLKLYLRGGWLEG